MIRNALLVAALTVGTSSLTAQAVPEGSQAAGVAAGYRRPIQLRVDPFRHVVVPRWGFVISGGLLAGNNSLNINDARAVQFIANDGDGLQASHVLDALNLIREGSGFEADGAGEGGAYLGGPIGSRLAVGLSAKMRGYGFSRVSEDAVRLLREGNGTQTSFSFGDTRGVTLGTLEAGAHALLRFGPLGSVDGVHATLGFGGRLIWPQYYAEAGVQASSQATVTPGSIGANVGIDVMRSDGFSFGTSNGSGFAADFLLRMEWPTSGLSLEAMVANVGKVTVNGLIEEDWSVSVNTTEILEVLDSLDADPLTDGVQLPEFTTVGTAGEREVTLPRIVRITGSSWANRILQLDASLTFAVRDDLDTPTIVNLGSTWRLLSWLPLHFGVEMNGRQGLGFTAGLGIESPNFIMRFYGGSLGGFLADAKGGAARLELGVFF